MRQALAVALALAFAASVHAGSSTLSCEAQYLKASESLQPASRLQLLRAWATYAAGYADSTDEAVEMLASLAANLKVDALARCMQRSLPPPFGTLDIIVPDGYQGEFAHATVKVDDRLVNHTDDLGQLTLTVKSGRHIVTAVAAPGYSISRLVDLRGRTSGSVNVEWAGEGLSITESDYGGLPQDCKGLHLQLVHSNVVELLNGSAEILKYTQPMVRLDAVLLAANGEVEDVTDLFTFENGFAVTTHCGEMLGRIVHPEPWRLLLAGRDAAGTPISSARRIWFTGTTLQGRLIVEGATNEELSGPFSLYRRGDPEEFSGSIIGDRFPGNSLPAGDYTLRVIAGVGHDIYSDTRILRLAGNAPIEIRLQKLERPVRLDPIGEVLLPVVNLGFFVDDSGHLVPRSFHQNDRSLTFLPSLSAASIAKMKDDPAYHNYVIAEVVDPQGRVVQRTMVGQLSPRTVSFYPELLVTRAKTLRLTGWLAEMTSTFDLTELAKLESK